MLDRWIEKRADAATCGETLNTDDALHFMEYESASFEAAYTICAANKISRKASKNIGQVYAQIGLDKSPCPANCSFCTLAAKNNQHNDSHKNHEKHIVPLDEIVSFAKVFDKSGVHLISLMSTAAYPFELFCETVAAVRQNINDDMPIMANIGDINLEQAKKLKKLGVQAFYHAHRLGEGVITSIAPERRKASLEAARQAGLQIMSAVEPVCANTAHEDIVGRMFEVIALHPYCSGVGSLTAAAGTEMENVKSISSARTKQIACIMRLCAGTSIPFGTGAGNVLWVDAGTNPRGRTLLGCFENLEYEVQRQKKVLEKDAWDVPVRPIKTWFGI